VTETGAPRPAVYEFGPFRLDRARHTLYRDGVETPLTPKLFDLLLTLVEARGATVDKDLLLARVWPDAVVEEGSLTRSISRLRTVLGEPAGSEQYIRTMSRRGYQFVAPIREPVGATHASPEPESPEPEGATHASPLPLAAPPPTRHAWWWIGAGAAIVAVAVVVFLRWIPIGGQAPPDRPKSVAILPFQVVDEDPSSDALGLGLADSLITRLANQERLTVRPTSAITRFAGRAVDSAAAGRELSVDIVLEGTLRRIDGRHRLTARLIDTSNGSQIWGSTFDETSTSLLTVEDRLASRLAEALPIALVSRGRSGGHGTASPEAYEAYLRGRFLSFRLTPDAFAEAQKHLALAIARDPAFARAYEAVAYLHVNTVDLVAPPHQAYPAAKAAVTRALELDPMLADAHSTLALILWQYDWDFAAAEREFRRAVELDPGGAFARSQQGFFLGAMGRAAESVEATDHARSLDPLSTDVGVANAITYYWARRYTEAADRIARVRGLDASLWLVSVISGRALEGQGRLDEAIAVYEQAITLDGALPEALMDLGRAYARAGRRADAERVLADLRAFGAKAYAAPFHAAVIQTALGNKTLAFAELEHAFTARSWYMTWLAVDPALDPLRSDPRFAALLKRVGF
jgi:DNA-binding winged helix-turn-helix (wHTH) protein/TolB-like protein/Tfp pilus assembly protein PilF